jgi:hypothetical protein
MRFPHWHNPARPLTASESHAHQLLCGSPSVETSNDNHHNDSDAEQRGQDGHCVSGMLHAASTPERMKVSVENKRRSLVNISDGEECQI